MKKILAIATIIFACATGAKAVEPIHDQVQSLDDRFAFADMSFDATTAFLDLGGNSTDINVDDVLKYAQDFLGTPYVFGAKGPKAFDCSGFTSYVYRAFDINLGASSQIQANQGQKISRGDIQPGDILVFRGRNNKSVGHVGIAVDYDDNGDVVFIHASTKQGVKFEKLSHQYYSSRFVSARRVIPE